MTRPPLERGALEALDRDALVAKAETANVAGARRLTKPELVDELLKRDGSPEAKKARGLLGMARDLLSRVIERGLHLPDAAERFRAARPPARTGPSRTPEAVPTVTLAEIYAAQGHRDKAVRTLEQVLASDPQNPTATSLLARLKDASVPLPPPLSPEPELEDAPQGSSSLASSTTTTTTEKVTEPSSMLDAGEPLPPRYDVDECVAMPVDPTTIYVYWEIREETLALVRRDSNDGSVALRVLVILPSWDGPKVVSRDIDVQSAVGDWFLRELPEGAVVRVAVGWRSNESGFVPAAHTYAVEPTPETRSPIVADLLVRWTPWGIEPASDPKALEIARAMALQEVRRHAIGAMAREAAAALGMRPLPEGIGGSSERWQRPLGSSELHPIA